MRFTKPHRPVADAVGSAAWLWRLSLAALLLAAPGAWTSSLRAQPAVGWIVVSAPSAWSDNRMLTVSAGSSVRVVGQAFHSSGIRSITVGDQVAELRPAPGGVVDFEVSIAVPPGVPSIAVIVTPTVGEPLGRSFVVRVLGGGPPPPAPADAYSPGGAAFLSLLMPGLGQVYTKRPLLGILFIGLGAGAAAGGVFYKELTVQCLVPLTNGVCPTGQEYARVEETPYLVAGLGAAGAVALLAAIEAYTSAKRLNRQGGVQVGELPSWRTHARPVINLSPEGLTLGIRLTP